MQYFLRIAKAPKQKKEQQSRAIFNADAVYFFTKNILHFHAQLNVHIFKKVSQSHFLSFSRLFCRSDKFGKIKLLFKNAKAQKIVQHLISSKVLTLKKKIKKEKRTNATHNRLSGAKLELFARFSFQSRLLL